MSIKAVREFLSRHNASVSAVAALGAALDALASDTPLDPALGARIDEVLRVMGVGDALASLSGKDAAPLLAEIRFTFGLDAKLLHAHSRAPGWKHVEAELLQAGGGIGSTHAMAITNMIVPSLEGLAARLGAPGASFLNVGVGVAGLATTMARSWPSLRILGIDPWQPSLALARENVAAAGFADRIELRELGAEDLREEGAFDLSWIPLPFIPERIYPAMFGRVHAALRPGGWVVIAFANPGAGEPQPAALARLHTVLYGGGVVDPAKVEGLVRSAGFVDVRSLSGPPGSLASFVVGRRSS